MTTEDNGNVSLLKPTSSSNEDLSEYTDADESISAPTEFLAEFLSAVMLKDYLTALKYCKLILQYEPNNGTAKEFYPLILEKLQLQQQQQQQQVNADEGSGNENESEDEEASEGNSSASGTDSENSTTSESSGAQEEEEEEGVEVEQGGGSDKQSKGSSDGDATTGSYSSLEDDEAETVDQLAALAARYQVDNVDLGNGNKIYGTHLASAAFQNRLLSNSNSNSNNLVTNMGNNSLMNAMVNNQQPPFGTSSDSESPTEPVSQQTVAMLRARVVPNKM